MNKINKTLCELDKKDFNKIGNDIKKVIMNPKYICKKCYRASSIKDTLCKPNKI